MLKKYWIVAGFALLAVQFESCENEMEEEEKEEVVDNTNTNTDTTTTGGTGGNTAVAYCDTASPTYDNTVKAIIDLNCATASSCHGAGSSFGVFTSYSAVNSKVSTGSFKNRVITQKNMPPNATLSATTLEKLQCWLDKNAPEK